MARHPRTTASTAELDAQITELQAARDAELARLYERRREAEREEHRQRGQLLVGYLAGPHGAAILDALRLAIAPRDRHLFGLDTRGADGPARRPSGNGIHPNGDAAASAQPGL